VRFNRSPLRMGQRYRLTDSEQFFKAFDDQHKKLIIEKQERRYASASRKQNPNLIGLLVHSIFDDNRRTWCWKAN
jgi:hypothetical protein